MTDASEAAKRCATCGEVKPLTLFSRNKQHRDGFQTRCKACVKIENQRYREKNGDVWRERQRARYHANPEPELERQRAHRKANVEAISQRRRDHYAANTEKILQQHRDYMAANADVMRAKREAYRATNMHMTEKRC